MTPIHRYLLSLPPDGDLRTVHAVLRSGVTPDPTLTARCWMRAAGVSGARAQHLAESYLSGARKWPVALSGASPLVRVVEDHAYPPLTATGALAAIRHVLGLADVAEPLPTGEARRAAKLLGVSEATISAVLSGKQPASRKLRKKLVELRPAFNISQNTMSGLCGSGIIAT